MLDYLPSIVACCAIYVARKNMGRTCWSPTLEKYTKYHVEQLMPCLTEVCMYIRCAWCAFAFACPVLGKVVPPDFPSIGLGLEWDGVRFGALVGWLVGWLLAAMNCIYCCMVNVLRCVVFVSRVNTRLGVSRCRCFGERVICYRRQGSVGCGVVWVDAAGVLRASDGEIWVLLLSVVTIYLRCSFFFAYA